MTPNPESPYKGLNAFEDSELDALLFFGREREAEIVVANLIASRLTVLYGPSGVGKSSLLRAAVARSLRRLPEEPLVVVFSQWSADPAVALSELVAGSAGVESGSMLSVIEAAQTGRDVYLVLDQAEEYFLYHADDAGPSSFFELLPGVLATPLRVNVLVSLREDSLAKLDRFTGRISGLFANTLRLDRLDRAAGRAAIARPVERYAELTGHSISIEAELVERVLDEVGAGQIESALGGLGVVEDDDEGTRIEAPYLQLVMQRLWDEERAAGSASLRVGTLERLGGAQHIVEEHLEGAIAELTGDEKDIAARLFNHLVTPSGTKIAHDVADLADFGHVTPDEVAPVLDTLAERRILRPLDEGGARRYEIFHDVLAEPVLAWRARHRTERAIELQLAESHRRRRRLQWLVAGALIALALMSAVSVFALDQRAEAREQARDANANELVANADAELDRDPELSLMLAREATRIVANQSSERALREALLASRMRGVIDVESPLVAVGARGDRVTAVTEDGVAVTVNRDTGRVVRYPAISGKVADASISQDGTAVVTTRDGLVYIISRDGSVNLFAKGAVGGAISPDASRVVILEPKRARLVDLASGRTLHAYAHPGVKSAAISSDNRRVVTGGADDIAHVWSGQSGRRVHTLTEHAGDAVALAFSPDGEFVASASTDGTGRIWRRSDWGLASILTGHTNALTSISFSADGEHVVTTGKDGTARVSHTESGDELFVLAGHQNWVNSAAFSGSAGSPVVTVSPDGTIRVWDAVFQPELEELASLAAPITDLSVERGRATVWTRDGREREVDLRTGQVLAVAAAPKLRPRRVAGPEEGTSATMRGRVVIVRQDGQPSTLTGHRDRVTSVDFSPLGEFLATGSLDHVARVWSLSTGEVVRALQHNNAVHDIDFSPDGRWLATATLRASIWDATAGENLLRLQGHDGIVTALAFDPSGRVIVTGGADGTVRTYRCGICGGVNELALLADARLAATGRVLTEDERQRYVD